MKKILATLFASALLLVGGGGIAAASDDVCQVSCGPTFTKEETAWGKGGEMGGANWAMFTPYSCACGNFLIAGNPKKSENKVGFVSFSPPDADGKISITIDVYEWKAKFSDPLTVHIGYYDSAPTDGKNPAPGQLDVNLEHLVLGVDYTFDAVEQKIVISGLEYHPYYAVHTEVLVK